MKKTLFIFFFVFVFLASSLPAQTPSIKLNENKTTIFQTTTPFVQLGEGNITFTLINRSEYWDNLNTPADINTGDITDDGTYILSAEENNLNVNRSNFWNDFNVSTDLNYLLLLYWTNITGRPTLLSDFIDDILWTSGFNTTFDSRDSDTTYTHLTNFTDDLEHVEDNESFNETYTDNLYADISVTGDNSSWNESGASNLYISKLGDLTPTGNYSFDSGTLFIDSTNNRVGIGIINPYSGLHYQGDIFYLTPNAGTDSNDNITIKNYATSNATHSGAPNIILRTSDIDGAYGIGVGTLYLIGGSKTTLYGGIGGGGGKISLQGGRGRDSANNPSSYAPILLQSNGGNVGIGTEAPGRNVEIYGTTAILRLRDSGATAGATLSYIEFGGTDGGAWNRTGYIGDGSSGNTDISLQAIFGDLHLGDSSGTNVLNLKDGNVGIGTDSPDRMFHMKKAASFVVHKIETTDADSDPQIELTNDARTWSIINRGSESDLLAFRTSGVNRLVIEAGGKVGIGTSSPNQKLVVVGNVNVTGNLTANFIYGETNIHPDGNITVTINTQNVHENITGFNETMLNGFTLSGNDSLVANVAGRYEADYWVSMSGGANRLYSTCLAVNGEHVTPHAHRKQGTPGDVGSMSGGGIIDLNVGDYINLQIRNEDGTQNADIFFAGMRLVRIGDIP